MIWIHLNTAQEEQIDICVDRVKVPNSVTVIEYSIIDINYVSQRPSCLPFFILDCVCVEGSAWGLLH